MRVHAKRMRSDASRSVNYYICVCRLSLNLLRSASGSARGVPAGTTREPGKEKKQKNSGTGRLLRLPDRLVPITMHHWTELIELDPIELQTKSISECGPAKWPSEDEKNASWRHRKAPRCARRGRPTVVRPGPRGSNMVSKCVYVIYEAP